MLMRNSFAAVLAVVMCSFSVRTHADDVLPGRDYWVTSEDGTYVEFGGATPVPPIPADFFGPGSDPFEGIISFMGDPIDPGSLRATSTITERLDAASLSPPYPSSAAVDIQFVELRLRAIEAIRITYNGGMTESLFDVLVSLNPLEPSAGQMTITQEHDGGGMYSIVRAQVFVQFNFIPMDVGSPATLIPPDPYKLEALGPGEMGYPWQLDPSFEPTFPAQGPNFFPIESMPDVNLYWPYGPPWVKVGAHPVTPYVTCCHLQDNSCRVITAIEAIYEGCIIQPEPCAGALQACCLDDGTCLMVDPTCCDDAGGVVMGGGCGGVEACCIGPDCHDVDAACCALVSPGGGEAQGPGTDCATTVCEGCGDGDCIPPEDQCNCPEDCGDPPLNETPLVNCQDTIDNDCDQLTDCDDPDCGPDPACEPVFIKWEQPPDLDPTGMDVMATFPNLVLADDFLCEVTGPITHIDVWGSWYQDYVPYPGNVIFTLSIHRDIPQGPDGWSIPGEVLWMHTFVPGEFFWDFYAGDLEEGWYDPSIEWYEPVGDSVCFLYSFPIPEIDQFIQQGTPTAPLVYWLDVQAQSLDDPNAWFGWKTTPLPFRWNDDAVWGAGQDPPTSPWIEMRYPGFPIPHPWAGESLDLAFRIFGRAQEPGGACCLDDYTCIETTEADCTDQSGIFEGLGTQCEGMEACCIAIGRGSGCIYADALCCRNEWGGEPEGPDTACMPDEACCYGNGDCLDYDPQCCVSQLWGTPQGQGNVCTAEEACCLGNGDCIMVDPLCCDDMGGTPQGPGTVCTEIQGCCLQNGTCLDLDPLCCEDRDGIPQGPGNYCVDMTLACCLPGGDCADTDPLCCDDLNGEPSPLGIPHCLADLNQNGINDACDDPPTIKWEQPPNPNLPGLHAHEDPPNGLLILADNWECHGGVVTDIHWWGSYEQGGSALAGFHLSIHENVGDPPGCLPGPAVWAVDIFAGEFYELETGMVNSQGEPVYTYHYYLEQPFEQVQGEIYWLDVAAYSTDPANPVRWKWQETQRDPAPIICPAAWRYPSTGWAPIEWPGPSYSDMAFVITSAPPSGCEPPDPEPGGPACTPGIKLCHGGPDHGSPCNSDADCASPGNCWEDCWDAWTGANCVVHDFDTGEARCYIPKNRYLSVDPTVNAEPVAYLVEIVEAADYDPGAVGRTWWLDTPVCHDYPNGEPVIPPPPTCDEGPDRFGWVSKLTDTPVTRVWTEVPVHLTDCAIAPAITCDIRCSADDGVTLSPDALRIMTAHHPLGETQSWGDVTGGPVPGDLGRWLPPEYATNFADVGNAIRTFENRTGDTGHPSLVWVDVEINQVVNLGDVQFIVNAFEGVAYPDLQLPEIGVDPVDCPPLPPRVGSYGNGGCEPGSRSGGRENRAEWCDDDIVEFTVEPGTLLVMHRNAEYWCAQADIRITLEVEGNLLRLIEEEIDPEPTDCRCCFNVEATVVDLAPGTYTARLCWIEWDGQPQCYEEVVEIP